MFDSVGKDLFHHFLKPSVWMRLTQLFGYGTTLAFIKCINLNSLKLRLEIGKFNFLKTKTLWKFLKNSKTRDGFKYTIPYPSIKILDVHKLTDCQ